MDKRSKILIAVIFFLMSAWSAHEWWSRANWNDDIVIETKVVQPCCEDLCADASILNFDSDDTVSVGTITITGIHQQ